MASYGSFARSARFAFRSSGRSTFRASGGSSQSSSNARPPLSSQRSPSGSNIANFRRRCAQSMIPLHDAVAAARLVSHLGVNSRSRSALPLGLDSLASGRIRAPFQGNLGNHSECFKHLGHINTGVCPENCGTWKAGLACGSQSMKNNTRVFKVILMLLFECYATLEEQ